ncbi:MULTISPECIES: major tail protein [unclassified Breznakia]|uniref:major tail protein n=1 Tax=unclassified Breznakia TaxID=2623764 RepID=UPI002475C23D|nr:MULTISPECIES: major tail protein [unclassified Breznakia]MDH6367133.1 phi13 family phage major tail protein [Breznakia sp. PH1-1]MDH6404280.1 phi13 family phage major tail protein [Breznakia sp. PF1-11]MDH6412021.1 phi13 family phage major tail protein [Breznakia sp. PFB1-11]MDH6414268.1 phi13 family phage major tail protein [Breznakia sp. PFB1-14]MDH6416635.1 phi13 family phage major tail protein [Breznakia sp. PFB1-4]
MKENIVRFGLKNVHTHKITIGEDELITLGPGVPFPGAVSLKLNAEGELTPFYADDTTYYVASSNNGYTGDLEVARITNEFLVDYLGYIKLADNTIVEDANANAEPFALTFEFDGDVKATRHILYKVNASRPSQESKTTEGAKKEPQTETLPITVTPIVIGDKAIVKRKTTVDTPQSTYDNWYKAPTMPDFTVEQPQG